jgi:ACR3 family arsenite transporter
MSAMNSKKEGAFASEQLPTDKTNNLDIEGQGHQRKAEDDDEQVSAFKSLGWLDRFLALWIILAMAIGIILGNFVPSTGPALEKGKFVGVSVPIGMRMIGYSL